MKTPHSFRLGAIAAIFVGTLPFAANAQLVVSDTLSGASSTLDWKALTGACLTAGDGTGKIPACIDSKGVNLPYYSGKTLVGGDTGTLPDKIGKGALRLTNGDTGTGTNGNNQTGAVVSNFTFPTDKGVKVTFTTVTYGGNAYKNNSGDLSGADGIAFFLMDGAEAPNVGGNGGSLGYSCSNGNNVYEGVQGGYIGLGMDEFGNFVNPGDNTASGPGVRPGYVGLRGAGSITWAWLNKNYPVLYPTGLSASDQTKAVKATCKGGVLYNFSGKDYKDPANKNAVVKDGNATAQTVYDYGYITSAKIDSGDPKKPIYLFNQEAVAKPRRDAAVPMTYALSITNDGLLSLTYSYNNGVPTTVLKDQSISAANGPLPSSFRFGFTSGTGGGSNVHEITCFKAEQINASSSSAGTNTQQEGQVEDGTQAFLAYYHPINSWGQVTATNLVTNTTTGAVSLSKLSNWDASCVLTGGDCTSTGVATTAPNYATGRTMFSWNPLVSAGIAFRWSDLGTAGLQTAIGSQDRFNFLRGDRSNEKTQSGTGTFRTRDSVLGDVVNSSPAWVGPPASPYDVKWVDALAPTASPVETAAGATSYSAFKTANASRTNVVYVGANDGFLHGFKAGATTSAGTFDKTKNTGEEVMAFMPAAIAKTIRPTSATLDFSNVAYAHNAYVDAVPAVGDLFYKGDWHTWLVGGLGGGGNASGVVADDTSTAVGGLYVLDVTKPDTYLETAPTSVVRGEYDSATIVCKTNTATVFCKNSMGSINGTPLIRRLHNGKWGIIFGNGFNSASGTSGIFVIVVDPAATNGINAAPLSQEIYFLDTNQKPATAGANKNGMSQVSSADLDGDHITDYVYGGDLYGNVWRFDLTSSDPNNWAVRTNPIFKAAAGQPISTRVTVASTVSAGAPRVVLSFGTGRKYNQTLTAAESFVGGQQAIYGIWDSDMTAWNAKKSLQYAVSASATTTITGTGSLQAQTMTTTVASTITYRTVSKNTVCWKDSNLCGSGNDKYGWYINLATGESIVYNPQLAYGLVLLNTTIPPNNNALSCERKDATGFTMAISTETGGAPDKSFFQSPASDVISADGVSTGATGSSAIVTYKGNPFLVQQTATGEGVVLKGNPMADGSGKRVNWIKMR